MLKPLTVWIATNCGKFLKRWDYQTTLPAYWKTCMQVKKQHLELDMEQQTSSKLGKENVKAIYCHPASLTSMQSTSCKMLGWMNRKLESRLSEVSTTSDIQMIPRQSGKQGGTKKPLNESESGEWKNWLKAQHSENEDHGIWSHHFMGNRWGSNGNSVRFYFHGLQNHHCRKWL